MRSQWVKVLRGDRCVYCGAPVEHIDHIEAKANGGADTWDNLTSACAACNLVKQDHGLLAFLLGRRPPPPKKARAPKVMIAMRLSNDLLRALEAMRLPGQTRTDVIVEALETGLGDG